MGIKKVLVCDRCDKPMNYPELVLNTRRESDGVRVKYELCGPCQERFYDWVH